MKKLLLTVCIILSLLGFSHLVFSWDINPSQEVRESGNIHGFVERCGPEGSLGIEIYIPGKSFVVKTGISGEFTLSHVPEGIYQLVFMLSDTVIESIPDVQVVKKSVTEVGTITVPCPDNDNDGYNLSVDCNDGNPDINPGVQEICNGLDDNCDGSTDEGTACLNCDDNDQDQYYVQPGCPGSLGEDCDDNDGAVNPGADEVCLDNIDNDCDGETDEGCPTCIPGNSCDPAITGLGVCADITGRLDGDCNCIAIYPDDYMPCDPMFPNDDGLDNDCDGQTDEDFCQ